MTTTPKALEDRIRERAVKEYKEKLTKAADAFITCTPNTNVRDPLAWLKVSIPDGKQVELAAFIKGVVNQAVDSYAVEIGDRAVGQFIQKVDDFQEQLDELKDSVNFQSEG